MTCDTNVHVHTHLHILAFHCSYIYTITGTLSVVPILYMSFEHSPTCRQHIHCAACCIRWVNSQLICKYIVYYCVLSQHLHWVGLYKFCCPLQSLHHTMHYVVCFHCINGCFLLIALRILHSMGSPDLYCMPFNSSLSQHMTDEVE